MVALRQLCGNLCKCSQKPKEEDYKNGGVLDVNAYNRAMDQFNDDLEVYNKTIGASVVMTIQSELDTLIHGIVTTVNDLLCPEQRDYNRS